MDAAKLSGAGMVNVAADVRAIVASVVDPEIPVLTIDDLGILRSVETDGDRVVVRITPTYSGCPAMRQMKDDIAAALLREGLTDHEIEIVHHPAWSTDWISERGKNKLEEFGIAPPTPPDEILCPRCREADPKLVARFGSTACKALMVCSSCGEPFDYFKELR